MCDICSHDDVTNDDSVNKLGEFQQDQFSLGDDFRTKSEPNTKYELLNGLVHANFEPLKELM